MERAALRQQALTAIAAFAATEYEVAQIHEELAASAPSRREEYRRGVLPNKHVTPLAEPARSCDRSPTDTHDRQTRSAVTEPLAR